MTVQKFLSQTKSKCEATAKKMAKLELSIWSATHDQQLKTHFGFNSKSLDIRKGELIKAIK